MNLLTAYNFAFRGNVSCTGGQTAGNVRLYCGNHYIPHATNGYYKVSLWTFTADMLSLCMKLNLSSTFFFWLLQQGSLGIYGKWCTTCVSVTFPTVTIWILQAAFRSGLHLYFHHHPYTRYSDRQVMHSLSYWFCKLHLLLGWFITFRPCRWPIHPLIHSVRKS